MPVRVVYYRPTHRHNWEMIGLWDQCDPTEPEEESNEFCLDLRKTAEWHAENDDRNDGTYEIACVFGLDEDESYYFDRSLPGWKTHDKTKHYIEWSV
jgi:hypothetical protein